VWQGRQRRHGESWNSSGRRRWGMNSALLCFGYRLCRRSYGHESTGTVAVAIRAGEVRIPEGVDMDDGR
jgi:hypothetical protein